MATQGSGEQERSLSQAGFRPVQAALTDGWDLGALRGRNSKFDPITKPQSK